MVEGKFILGKEGLATAAYIRSTVFSEELGVAPEVEQDVYDQFAHHLVISDGVDLVGTGRLIIKDGEFLIGRIAVLPSARGNRYGDLIVRMLLARAFDIGAEEVVVHSQPQVESFYKTIGFEPKGETFTEIGLPHKAMTITEKKFRTPCQCGEGGCSQ